MRPATLRSSQTEKIAETSMKPIRSTAAITASKYGHKAMKENANNATAPGSSRTPTILVHHDGRYSIEHRHVVKKNSAWSSGSA